MSYQAQSTGKNGAPAKALHDPGHDLRSGGTLLAGKLNPPPFVFEDNDVVRLLRAAVELEGSQNAFARRHGVERGLVNRILLGKRPVSLTIAKALGLHRVYTTK
jgi:hypothetical protein